MFFKNISHVSQNIIKRWNSYSLKGSKEKIFSSPLTKVQVFSFSSQSWSFAIIVMKLDNYMCNESIKRWFKTQTFILKFDEKKVEKILYPHII